MEKKNQKSKLLKATACVHCCESINIQARVCPHCGGAQNWRKFFAYGNSTLALIVALVSVISMGTPLVLQAIKKDDSELALSYIDRPDVMISIIASNKGSRPAVVDSLASMRMTIQTSKGNTETYIFMYRLLTDAESILKNRDSLVIGESESKILYYQMQEDKFSLASINKISNQKELTIDNIEKCEFITLYTNFSGSTGKKILNIFERDSETDAFDSIAGSMDCLIKIPDPLRERYKLFLPN